MTEPRVSPPLHRSSLAHRLLSVASAEPTSAAALLTLVERRYGPQPVHTSALFQATGRLAKAGFLRAGPAPWGASRPAHFVLTPDGKAALDAMSPTPPPARAAEVAPAPLAPPRRPSPAPRKEHPMADLDTTLAAMTDRWWTPGPLSAVLNEAPSDTRRSLQRLVAQFRVRHHAGCYQAFPVRQTVLEYLNSNDSEFNAPALVEALPDLGMTIDQMHALLAELSRAGEIDGWFSRLSEDA